MEGARKFSDEKQAGGAVGKQPARGILPKTDRLNAPLEVDFEGGVREIVRRTLASTTRPVLIAVYGLSDSGKTHLIERAIKQLEEERVVASLEGGGPSPTTFDMLQKYEYYYGDALFFHCAWDRTSKGLVEQRDEEDPNVLAGEHGMRITLNVGIYNPKMHGTPSGEYDIVIRNPDAVEKK